MNTVLVLQPSADVASGSLLLYPFPDVGDAGFARVLGVADGLAAQQANIDALLTVLGYAAGDLTIGGDDGSFQTGSGHGWTITFQGTLANRNVPPILAFDASGLSSGVTPGASYSAADATYGQSYVAPSSGTAAGVTFSFSVAAEAGTWTCNGQSAAYDDVPSVAGWAFSGTPNDASVICGATSIGSGQTEPTVDPSGLYSTAGTTAGVTFSLVPDDDGNYPDAGTYSIGDNITWDQVTEPYTAIGPYGGYYSGTIGSGQSPPPYDLTGLTYQGSPWTGGMSFSPPYGSFTDGTDPSGSITVSDNGTWQDGTNPVTGQPQIDRLTVTASGGYLTITAGSYGSISVNFGVEADSAACCTAVQQAVQEVLQAASVSDYADCMVAVNTGAGATPWSPTTWDLLITLPLSVGSQSWTVDGSTLTDGITVTESVQTPGSGAAGGRFFGVEGGVS